MYEAYNGRYDYRTWMSEDIREFLIENHVHVYPSNRGDVYERLNDHLWVEDSVTGNGSGSYYFSREESKKAVLAVNSEDEPNICLALEMADEFDCMSKLIKALREQDWEWIDVSIRCYLLGDVLADVLDERMEDEPEDEGNDSEFDEEEP